MNEPRHTWSQSKGEWRTPDGTLLFDGYAGGNCGAVPEAANNPAFQYQPNVGPLPQGLYNISELLGPEHDPDHVGLKFGPNYCHLWESNAEQMRGRSGMLLHWDSPRRHQSASEGCIVPYVGAFIAVVAAHPCKLLEVIP